MSALRQRIRSPLSTSEQRQNVRRQLAQLLLVQRQERHRDRDRRHSAGGRLTPFNRRLSEMTSTLARGNLRLLSVAAAAGGAAVSLSKLSQAANSKTIEELKDFNPLIAAISSRNALFEMQQRARRGVAVAGTTRQAADSILQLRKKLEQYQVYVDNAQNLSADALAKSGNVVLEFFEKIGLEKMVKGVNDELARGSSKTRGHLLETLDDVLKGSLTRDPQLQNRRPNERPGGRM